MATETSRKERDMNAEPQFIGLHTPIYFESERLDRYKAEIAKMRIRLELGDKISELESLAVYILRQNGLI